MRDAMDIIYNSKTHNALNNLDTGLYFQGHAYVYDVLEGKYRIIKLSIDSVQLNKSWILTPK